MSDLAFRINYTQIQRDEDRLVAAQLRRREALKRIEAEAKKMAENARRLDGINARVARMKIPRFRRR